MAQSDKEPAYAAWVIESQLRVAEALRQDPRFDLQSRLPGYENAFPADSLRTLGWDDDSLLEFWMAGLVEDRLSYRGFIEHVAMKAKWFLETAEELYANAPIRLLTPTY
jgi:hypothetical protein